MPSTTGGIQIIYRPELEEEELTSVIAGLELYRLAYEAEQDTIDIEDEDYRSIVSAMEKVIAEKRRVLYG